MPPLELTLGQCATLACLLEVTAAKPGNVHRGADFDDAVFADFAASAVLIAPAVDETPLLGVGRTVLRAVQATRSAVPTNTNLGILLLIAPLAAVPRGAPLAAGVEAVLNKLTPADAHAVYEAIRLAEPGGLGDARDWDVRAAPPDDLRFAMRLAAERDLVARQYAHGFREVLESLLPWLREGIARGWPLTTAIVHAHIRSMASFPDTLIARKGGHSLAARSAELAHAVLAQGTPDDEAYWRGAADLDFWLRSDGRRRNPGATADLVTAALFAGLREGSLPPPWR